jgi:hypothetical protein
VETKRAQSGLVNETAFRFRRNHSGRDWLRFFISAANDSANVLWRAEMKYWETIANRLMKAGWSLGYVSAVDSEGRTIWIADAHRGDGKRFVVRGDEKLTAFLELEPAIQECSKKSDFQQPSAES